MPYAPIGITTERPTMQVNPNRDVIIIGHPRSGSFWFQSCLPQFNCREAFNTVNLDITGSDGRKFTMTPYRSVLMEVPQENQEIQRRIQLVNDIAVPKSVKILTFQFMYAHRTKWNENIFNWVDQQDADVIWIKRRDQLAGLKSLLIADALGKYLGPIDDQSVTINLERLPWILDTIGHHRDQYILDRINRAVEYVYYEDLVADNTFDKSLTHMQEQNTTRVNIENWHQVVENIPVETRNDLGL